MSKKPIEDGGLAAEDDDTKTGDDSKYRRYQRIQIYEHHFNDTQAGIRKLASVWLLAGLGAIAYAVRESMSGSMIDEKILVSIVGLMGVVGLLVLLILDQVVYQRLINSVFLLGLRMEYLYRTLPPIRTLMMLYSRKRGMARYMRVYYLVPMFTFAIIALFSSVWYIYETGIESFSTFVPLIIGMIAFAIPLVAYWKCGVETAEFGEIAEGFKDKGFIDFLNKQDYERNLRGH